MGSLTDAGLRQSSHQRFFVSETADVGAVRRAVTGYADRLRAGPGLAGRAGQAATELATNLLRHASPGGWMLVRPLPPAAVEIIAVDHGPGITDVAAGPGPVTSPGRPWLRIAGGSPCLLVFRHGYRPGRPTTVFAVVESGGTIVTTVPRPRQSPRCWAGVSVGIDEACGDAWAVAEAGRGSTVIVVDGLGHGVHASMAAAAAVATLADDPADLDGYLARANAAMRGTRGAAVMVCRLESERSELRCLSVGNISGGILCHGVQRTLVPTRGTVGTGTVPPRTKITCYPWPPGAVLAVWTDGLAGRIDLARYGDLFSHDPVIAAAALHRDHSSGRDDSTVVVAMNHARP